MATAHEVMAEVARAGRELRDAIPQVFAAHARRVAGHGASTQEVAEAIGVAIMMNGGPGTVWGPRAFAAVKEYQQDAP
ncbi:MAG TPA: hypothetical protein VFJ17_06235 [Mycobacteriales bacterium]|jgi:alkylhydroperoxidase/carboxymuconolactone decarboxylase family protein YurZ|nr:hypothetical protein [Mycobacteriales bacterium]